MPDNIQAKVGETFEITLAGSAGTGFRWELEPLPAAGQLVKLLEESREALSTVPGGQTLQHFRFQALSPGNLELTFRNRRAWEDPASGTVQTIMVQINAPN